MIHLSKYQAQFELRNACVLIPTYNNASSVAAVIDDVLAYTHNIILVNDGSTDDTRTILSRYPALQVVSYAKRLVMLMPFLLMPMDNTMLRTCPSYWNRLTNTPTQSLLAPVI
jgi:Glycosyl transferase family 2